MKQFYQPLLIALLMSLSSMLPAQSPFVSDLNQTIQYGKESRDAARNIKQALRNLAIDYFQMNNPTPNTAAYLGVVQTELNNIETAADEVNFFINAAASKNGNIDPQNITAWASLIEGRGDFVDIESQNLANAISNGQRQAARTANNLVRGYLNEIIQASVSIINEAKALRSTPMPVFYDVRIQLVDNNGNPINGSTGLQGYYAFDGATNTYIWAGSQQGQDPDLFPNLAAGTYTFGAVDGYFDGASSETVTLSASSPTNSDGEIEVELVYWSE